MTNSSSSFSPPDDRKYADDEAYLFGEVAPRFAAQGWLAAYDVLSIARWKANRARTHVARRLVSKGAPSVEEGARALTRTLSAAPSDEARFLSALSDWGFLLPMGSAILTVCYPTTFTVYDVRVCSELGRFSELGNMSPRPKLWARYCEFMLAVRDAAPTGLSLRDCDRFLWGRSRRDDLEAWLASPALTPASLLRAGAEAS